MGNVPLLQESPGALGLRTQRARAPLESEISNLHILGSGQGPPRWSSALEPALGVFHGVSAGGCLVLPSFYFEDILSPSCIRNSVCGSGVFLSSGPVSFYVTFSINGMKMEKAKETEKV